MTPNSTEERVALPGQGKLQMLLSMVEHDIDRDGETASFMVRVGLLRDILKFALTRTDNDVSGLVEALEWYAEQVEGCRKLGSIGDPFRHALDHDGGKRAAAALAKHRQSNGGAE